MEFEPKVPVELDSPKDELFTPEELAQYDGSDLQKPIYVAIKGTIFDVSRNKDSYGPGKGYSIFAGKEANRALGKSSLKLEDCIHDYSDLDESEKKTLNDWICKTKLTEKTQRYNIVGKVKRNEGS
ncbi:putative steroid-binding protein 3 [Neolecta irregularis DAH-3]|uniref:Putative steroid-binding protein 3 n=1 Tax=Neolecta irregularis (strain DAH-3) TaxID=1198029 RepID=A0A1U7LQ34_NEOID|nr:putative steroid-binding protein 3 [Neolecta irregularis DAH-3]|eukprot:OLL24767.1 putative steroid-binding protein 3 [Neolecta irregularis DAH-3]